VMMLSNSVEACPRAEMSVPSFPAAATIRMLLSRAYLSADFSDDVSWWRVVCVPSGLIWVKSKLRLTTALGCFEAFAVSTNSIRD